MSDTPPKNPDEPLSTEESTAGYPEEQAPGADVDEGNPDRRSKPSGTRDEAALDDDSTATGNPGNAGDEQG